ncbi:MAG TPA: efflux RND transporter periplasmic adaptor subunit [Opitutaceae bacterium]|nr:efflux RND transporter periplasmic adaptor subunit [Opitutaceae bacterium]
MANNSRTGLKFVVILAVLAIAAVAALRYFRPVAKVALVTKGPAINAVPGSVVIEAEKFMELKSEVGGRILTSNLDLGRPVKEDDLLVQIDTRDLDLEISQLNSEYQAKKSQLDVGSSIELELATAKDTLEFSRRQAERGLLATLELEKRVREVAAIQQRRDLEKIANQLTLETFENNLKKDQRQKEKMSIRAPFDGVVTAVYAYKGALIGANERIATFITTSRTVEAKISEENFSGIRLGQHADVTFLGGAGGREAAWIYSAKVSKILPSADPDTQRYIVYLDVDIPVEDLIPGKTGEVTIVVGQHQAKAIVPRRALIGNHVYVVKDGRVEIRPVKIGFTWLKGAEILDGVQEGDAVIVDQIDQYSDGQRVVAEEVAAAPAGAENAGESSKAAPTARK